MEASAGEGEASAGVGGEDSGVADHVKASRGDEGAEAKEELAGLEAQDVATVGEAAFHRVEDRAVGGFLQATLGKGWAQGVATEVFETLTIVVGDGGGGM